MWTNTVRWNERHRERKLNELTRIFLNISTWNLKQDNLSQSTTHLNIHVFLKIKQLWIRIYINTLHQHYMFKQDGIPMYFLCATSENAWHIAFHMTASRYIGLVQIITEKMLSLKGFTLDTLVNINAQILAMSGQIHGSTSFLDPVVGSCWDSLHHKWILFNLMDLNTF